MNAKGALLLVSFAFCAGGLKARAQEPKATPAEKKPAAAAAGLVIDKAKLLKPADLTEQAPASFKVKFETTKGSFTLDITRDWAPKGADRFYNLVKNGYFDDVAFFRCIKGFMVQFGINGDPKINAAWQRARITDDPVKESNKPGYVSFATSGPDSRTTQMFINFVDNSRLDSMGFAPFGKVSEGMDVVEKLNGEYGEGAPRGKGPAQDRLQNEGNEYLKKSFPNMDYVKTARIMQP